MAGPTDPKAEKKDKEKKKDKSGGGHCMEIACPARRQPFCNFSTRQRRIF